MSKFDNRDSFGEVPNPRRYPYQAYHIAFKECKVLTPPNPAGMQLIEIKVPVSYYVMGVGRKVIFGNPVCVPADQIVASKEDITTKQHLQAMGIGASWDT